MVQFRSLSCILPGALLTAPVWRGLNMVGSVWLGGSGGEGSILFSGLGIALEISGGSVNALEIFSITTLGLGPVDGSNITYINHGDRGAFLQRLRLLYKGTSRGLIFNDNAHVRF
ncbi:hypothetical protein LENED_005245 [Lentinula edodes]|uniref:Uncharacterized protein n=1 Tax=Lentinula edodes TaxID=5353 RepID=A0A1Q3E8E5_LENED|nr:hypothetical protein LENED_005245 [Lentinula edodes]